MIKKVTKEEALEYHRVPNPGKVAISTTTKLETKRDLSLAYTPGVAFPCEEIQRDPNLAFVTFLICHKYSRKKTKNS